MANSAARNARDNAPSTLLGNASIGLSIAGAVTGALGAYYAVQASQYRAKSQALALDLQQDLSYIDARRAERAAQGSLLAGHREAARAGLRYGQVRAALKTRQASSGVQAGVGSAGEVVASVDYAKEADQLVITRNAVQQANAYRTGAVNAEAQARAAGVSGDNLLRTAGLASPGLAASASLLGGAGQVAKTWYSVNKSR